MSSVFKQLVSVSFILKTLISLGKKKKNRSGNLCCSALCGITCHAETELPDTLIPKKMTILFNNIFNIFKLDYDRQVVL